jgi:glycosyltransferase involved in cell wall biosynthesis
MSKGKRRIAIVNSHPIQYFAPLYAYLSSAEDIELTVFYLSDSSIRGAMDPGFNAPVKWDVDLLSGYSYRFIGGRAHEITPGGFFSLVAPELWSEIKQGEFDAVLVYGHGYAANFLAMAAAKLSGAHLLVRGESNLSLRRNGLWGKLRKPVLSWLYGCCDGVLAIGTANREFYEALGVPAANISLVPYAVDNERFVRQSSLGENERREARAAIGIPDGRPAVIYAAKFQKRKHPEAVVKAAQVLAAEGIPLFLVLAGSGEMEPELTRLVNQGGPAGTAFVGFVNQSMLPRLFGACDVFVLPAEEEPWGLTVNEAMCAGLPVVVGEQLGCVPDLVRAGENGFTVAPGDAGGVADALRIILTDARLRESMAACSRRIIAGWGYAQCLDGWRSALARLPTDAARDRAGTRTYGWC